MTAKKTKIPPGGWFKRATATFLACSLAVIGCGLNTPAAQASDITAPSGAEAEFLEVNLAGGELLTLGNSHSEHPQGIDRGNIDVSLLDSALDINLPVIDIPLLANKETGAAGLLDLANVGTLESYANSTSPNWARASTGLVDDDGALSLTEYNEADLGTSKVDLTLLLEQLGLADALGVVIDEAAIEIGAVGAQMTTGNLNELNEEDCMFYIKPEYVLSDLKVKLDSPLVGGIMTSIEGENGVLAGLTSGLDTLIGPDGEIVDTVNGVLDPIEAILNMIDIYLVEVRSEVGINELTLDTAPILDTVRAALEEPLVSNNGNIAIDLATGEITIDLAKYALQAQGVDSLNDLPANTPVLDSNTVNAILDDITDLLIGEGENTLLSKIMDATIEGLYNTELNITLGVHLQTCQIGGLLCQTILNAPILIGGTLGGFLGVEGHERPAIDLSEIKLIGVPLGTILQPIAELLEGLITSIGSIIDRIAFGDGGLIDGVQTALVGENGVLTNVLNGLVGGNGNPGLLHPLLTNAAEITINHQPDVGRLGTGGHTVSALTVSVLPAGDVVEIRFGTATAKATAPTCLTLTDSVEQDSQFAWATQAKPEDWILSATGSFATISGITGTPEVTERPLPQNVYTIESNVVETGITGGLGEDAYDSRWACTAPNGDTVPYTAGTIDLHRPANWPANETYIVTCHELHELITGTAQWTKVSSETPDTPLDGSSWTIDRINDPTQTAIDVSAHSSATNEGEFAITGLPVGKYELNEIEAPLGYLPLSGTITFEVFPDGTTNLPTKISNDPIPMPEIPLTGGTGEHTYLITGGLIMLIGLAIALALYRERNGKRNFKTDKRSNPMKKKSNHAKNLKNGMTKTLIVAGLTALTLSAFPTASMANNIDMNATGSLNLYKQATDGTTIGSPTGTPAANGTPLEGATFSIRGLENVDLSTTAGWNNITGITLPNNVCDSGTFNLGDGTPAELGGATSETTDEAGLAAFTNLNVGAYLVCETVAPTGAVGKAAPFIASVPYFDETSNQWLYDVTAYPKNIISGQAQKQIIEGSTISKPGYITYQITQTIPQLQASHTFKYFIVEEPFEESLSIENLERDITVILDGVTLEKDSDYVITKTGNNISVGFTATGLQKLNTASGKDVVVEFATKATAPNDGDSITNTAYVYMNIHEGDAPTTPPTDPADPEVGGGEPGGDGPGGIPSQTVKSYSGNYSFSKVDSKDGTKTLEGAEFGVYPAADPFNETCTTDIALGAQPVGTYASDENGTVNIEGLFIDSRSSSTGLEPENDERCYVLVETESPEGYILPTSGAEKTAIKVGAGENTGADIANTITSMPDMPITGAIGQFMMVIGGFIALLTAGGIALLNRRKTINS